MAGYLTTHVLDTARGSPAAGLEIELYRMVDNEPKFLTKAITNDDGRTDNQILSSENVHYHVPLLLSPFGYSTYRGS